MPFEVTIETTGPTSPFDKAINRKISARQSRKPNEKYIRSE